MKEFFIYWHPGNKVDLKTPNPLVISISGISNKDTPDEIIKEEISFMHANMKDIIILDGKLTDADEKLIFEKFKEAGQSK